MANTFFSNLFILIGLLLVAGGIAAFFQQRSRIARSLTTEGVVVELLPLRSTGDYTVKRTRQGVKLEKMYSYRPVICFKTQSGRTIKFLAALASRPATFEIGDRVEILYDPDDPDGAQINSFYYLWFYVIMLVFWGVVTAAMGYFGIMLNS